MYHISSFLPSTGRYLDCFHFLDIMNRVAMDTVEQMSLKQNEVIFVYMPGLGGS